MNISAISGVKSANFPKNVNYINVDKKNESVNSDYKYSALDKMSSLGKSLVQQSQKRLAVSFTGWSPEPHNKETIEKMVKIIKDPSVEKIAISGHTSPDGDSFGTTFAMANLINQATGKKVDLFVFGNTFPERYKYLDTNPDVNVIVHKPGKYAGSDKAMQKYGKYDLAIACDCAESKLMAEDYKGGVLDKAKYSFKIDHHPYKEEYSEKYGKTFNNK